MSSISDELTELKSNVTRVTGDNVEGAGTWNSVLLVQLLLPLTLVSLVWGRKWLISRALLQLDRTCISVLCPSMSKRERLLRWTTEQLPRVLDVQFRSLWLDGSHLCTLINGAVPGACANPHRHWRKPPTHAQALAFKYFGIVPAFTDADLKTNPMTATLEQAFQTYLIQLQEAISKVSQEQELIKQTRSRDYVARGMGLVTGEQHRKNFFYIYPTPRNKRYEDVIVTMKGPYNIYGSVILSSLNLLNSRYAAYNTDLAKDIYRESENLKANDRSYLQSLSIDLTNIIHSDDKKETDTLEFDVKVEKGRAKVAFISKNNGIHELCITTNGEHISGSPFNIHIEKNTSAVLDTFVEVATKPSYRVINRKVIKKEIDFVSEKLVYRTNSNLYESPVQEENKTAPVEVVAAPIKKKLTKQDNIDLVDNQINFTEVQPVSARTEHFENVLEIVNEEVDENTDTISNIAEELELLAAEASFAELSNNLNMSDLGDNSLSTSPNEIKDSDRNPPISEINSFLNYSSDLSNIEMEEIEDTEVSEPASLGSPNKISNVPKAVNKLNTVIRKHSKTGSVPSMYCSSEFSTNSIELEEIEDNDLCSDEFLYFGQNIFPEGTSLKEDNNECNTSISVKERIAYYNKSPKLKKMEDSTVTRIYTVNTPAMMECSTYEPDILACHTVKYSEIKTYASPIWKHIVQEENPNQNMLNVSSETDPESDVLNQSTISSYSSNKQDYFSSDDSYNEENNNSISNIPDFQKNDQGNCPQSYYNRSSDEFSEMFRKRKQFWHRKSVENSSDSSSSESNLSNPIVSTYSFYNNRRLSSEKSFQRSENNVYGSLDCFQTNQCNVQIVPDDDICKSTDDLAFPSVKERKLHFIKEMNNHWSKNQANPVKHHSTRIRNHKPKDDKKPETAVIARENDVEKLKEFLIKAPVMKKIKIFQQDTDIKTPIKQPILQASNKENAPNAKDFVPMQTKKSRKSETIQSNKENFLKAQTYFKTLESGKKAIEKNGFSANRIERRHSSNYETKNKTCETDIKGGSLRLPRVSEKFPLDNIYKDVLGDRKNASHLKGSANKVGMIVTLLSMPDQSKSLDVKSEFKEELFFGQKKFKDRPKLNSVFPIHY